MQHHFAAQLCLFMLFRWDSAVPGFFEAYRKKMDDRDDMVVDYSSR